METAEEVLTDYMTVDGEYGKHRIPGTEDWVIVASEGEWDYSWTMFKAFYSPSARRFFWHGDSGCSCNSWSDDLTSSESFENGDRDALLRAWETFAKDRNWAYSIEEYQKGISHIREFEVK